MPPAGIIDPELLGCARVGAPLPQGHDQTRITVTAGLRRRHNSHSPEHHNRGNDSRQAPKQHTMRA